VKPGSTDPFLSRALATATSATSASASVDSQGPPDLTPPPRPTPPATSRPAGSGPGARPGDLGSELDRLAALHRSGDLSDAEFEAAKSSVIQKGGR
jgi:hypothetical protein